MRTVKMYCEFKGLFVCHSAIGDHLESEPFDFNKFRMNDRWLFQLIFPFSKVSLSSERNTGVFNVMVLDYRR